VGFLNPALPQPNINPTKVLKLEDLMVGSMCLVLSQIPGNSEFSSDDIASKRSSTAMSVSVAGGDKVSVNSYRW
jgi:hypothetical protein